MRPQPVRPQQKPALRPHVLRNALKRRDVLLMLALSLIGAVSAVAYGRATLMQREHARASQYAASTLHYAERIAGDIAMALHKLQARPAPACSEADMDMLRAVLFESSFLRDAMRLDGGRIGCSAMWGERMRGTPLPSPDMTTGEYRMWRDMPMPTDTRIRADVTAMDRAAVVTAPLAFAEMSQPAPGAGAVLRNRSGTHVFEVFGDDRAMQSPDGMLVRRCSTRFDICVGVHSPSPAWLASPSPLLAWLTPLGAIVGAAIGVLLIGARLRHRSLPMQLRRALKRNGRGLALQYQPLRTLEDRRMRGVEALLRWRDEEGAGISPGQFIPWAEQLGLGGELSRWVVRRALEELHDRLHDDSGFYVSINVSAGDIVDAAFQRYIQDEARRHRVDTGRIALEITERSTASHGELVQGIQALRTHGFRIYIDDFGTGYSSLSYLADLPIDAIKMDRAFTGAIGTGSPAESIIGPICELAHELRIALIVEGVEEESQASHILRIFPTALAQGWLLGRPMPAAELPSS